MNRREKSNRRIHRRATLLVVLIIALVATSTRLRADTGTCGGASTTLPFTDVPSSNIFFCAIAEAYFSGLTNGTTPTTYNPSSPVPREQMSAFITRAMDQSVKRSSRRAALDQFWNPRGLAQGFDSVSFINVGDGARLIKSDGTDVWVTNVNSGTVSRVRARDGELLETWTGATGAVGLVVVGRYIFVVGQTNPGSLYRLEQNNHGYVEAFTDSHALGANPQGIAFDGKRLWTANFGTGPGTGSVSIITLGPMTVTNIITGFSQPAGILYDGANIWVTDQGDDRLKKLDSDGNTLLSVSVGVNPLFPAFDGANIWVPNETTSTVSVVRATGPLAGTVVATLTGNELNNPTSAAFDGERIVVTNFFGNSVSLWKATDLMPIGTISFGGLNFGPFGACSDGLYFWVTLYNANRVARF
jgi:hypothetical protein